MKKRLMAGLVAGGLMAAMVPGVASASFPGDPVGGCPTGDGWSLVPIAFVIPDWDNGNYKDQNGDGWICFKSNPGLNPEPFPVRTWKDNTQPIEEV
ncbi:MAG: hypothetical protein AB1Z63_04795 [Candidatus Limnocylindrales bacterium]